MPFFLAIADVRIVKKWVKCNTQKSVFKYSCLTLISVNNLVLDVISSGVFLLAI